MSRHAAAFVSLLLLHAAMAGNLLAESLNEATVRTELLRRFDENRNGQWEPIEARTARSRLRDLLNEELTGDISIALWRNDLHELLRSLDQDADDRVSPTERQAAATLLQRIIPVVERMSQTTAEATDPEKRRNPAVRVPATVSTPGQNAAPRHSEMKRGFVVMMGGGFGMNSIGFDADSSRTSTTRSAEANSSARFVPSNSSGQSAANRSETRVFWAGANPTREPSANRATGVSIVRPPLGDRATATGRTADAGLGAAKTNGASADPLISAGTNRSKTSDAGPSQGSTPGTSGGVIFIQPKKPSF